MDIKQKLQANSSSVIVIVLGVILIIGGLIYSKHRRPNNPLEFTAHGDCATEIQDYVVEPGSTDIFPAGSSVQVEMNYYNCHPGAREDIVMLKVSGRMSPLLESIRMIPGDTFEVREDKNRKYTVYVNGDALENTKGEKYLYDEHRVGMIKLYEPNFKKGIRKDVYFTFFDDTTGGFDATRLGPVMPESMVGKVITKPGNVKVPASVVTKDEQQKLEPKKDESKKDESKKVAPAPAPLVTAPAKVVKPKPAVKPHGKQ